MVKFQVQRNNQRLISLACGIDIKRTSKLTKSTKKFFKSIWVNLILFMMVTMLVSFAVTTSSNSYDFATRLIAASFFIALGQAIATVLNIGVKIPKSIALNRTLQSIVDGEGKLCFLWRLFELKCLIQEIVSSFIQLKMTTFMEFIGGPNKRIENMPK